MSEFPVGVSENNPSETVRKGTRVASEGSILVVSTNGIELLGPVSSVFRLQSRAYQDFSDTLSETVRKGVRMVFERGFS